MIKKILPKLIGTYLNTIAHVFPKLTARHGLQLFCHPFRSPLKKYQQEFLNSADLFSFVHDGVSIQGYRWGNGEKKILFLHGWQSHTFRWKAHIEALSSEEYSIYAIDAPGHGLSGGQFLSVPHYSAVIQQLLGSLGNVHAIVAHSLGSFSSLYAFYQNPALPVNKLVLLAPPGEARDFIDFYQQTLQLSSKTLNLVLNQFEKEFKKPIHYFSTQKFAADVSVEGLIIHDEGDLETPYHYAVKINEHWKASTLITTKGLGHNLKSKEVVKSIIDFIAVPVHQPVMMVKKDLVLK